MNVVGTWNGSNVYALPCDTGNAYISAPSELEWSKYDVVSRSSNPFTGQEDIFDWMAAWWMATMSFAAMPVDSQSEWMPFLGRGGVTVFQLGDWKKQVPRGTVPRVTQAMALASLTGGALPAGAALVNGAGQSGYTLNIKGLTPGEEDVFRAGDMFQVGWRAYEVQSAVNADGSGNATLSIWPPLRVSATETIADGAVLITQAAKSIFRLAKSNGNTFSSTSTSLQGIGAIAVREAL